MLCVWAGGYLGGHSAGGTAIVPHEMPENLADDSYGFHFPQRTRLCIMRYDLVYRFFLTVGPRAFLPVLAHSFYVSDPAHQYARQ